MPRIFEKLRRPDLIIVDASMRPRRKCLGYPAGDVGLPTVILCFNEAEA